MNLVRRLPALLPAIALGVSLYFIDLPLFVEGPGPAHDVIPRIDIDGVRTYQPDDRLLFTTVNVGRVNLYDAVWAGFQSDWQIVHEDVFIPPGFTDEEYNRVTLSQMGSSKIAAVVSVLRRFTDYPREHGDGALVYKTVPGAPADGRLFPGDVITAVEGEPIGDRAALASAIEGAEVGEVLELEVTPVGAGRTETVEVRTTEDRGRPIIGVYTVASFPFEVTIESGRIGGPSAGLMWALGITDLLTPGDLGGGRDLAGTGGILLDGRIVPIGGVRLKILAADRAGAEVFFVPQANMAEARSANADIELVPVANLQDALDYLQR
jgi:PDZ domain-containing protein